MLRLRRYERISVQNRRFRSNRGRCGRLKISGRRGRPTNHSSQKTRLNDLSYGIKILTDLFFRFVTMHAFDRRTDRRPPFSSLVRAGIPCSAEKNYKICEIKGVFVTLDVHSRSLKIETGSNDKLSGNTFDVRVCVT